MPVSSVRKFLSQWSQNGPATTAPQVPATTMTAETGSDEALPLEFMDFMKISEISEGILNEPNTVNANVCVLSRWG